MTKKRHIWQRDSDDLNAVRLVEGVCHGLGPDPIDGRPHPCLTCTRCGWLHCLGCGDPEYYSGTCSGE